MLSFDTNVNKKQNFANSIETLNQKYINYYEYANNLTGINYQNINTFGELTEALIKCKNDSIKTEIKRWLSTFYYTQNMIA